jgi:glycosyltransferase involved in cell wall biosynthesis
MHTISVIIPALNMEAFIEESLDSIARQRRLPQEIIIADNGSTDDTLRIAKAWAAKAPIPTKIITESRKGASAARNAALRNATGELVANLDADDTMLPENLYVAERVFKERSDVVFAFGDVEVFDRSTVLQNSLVAATRPDILALAEAGHHYILDETVLFRSLLHGNWLPTATWVFRANLIAKVGGFDENLETSEDRDFVLRVAQCGKGAFYPSVLGRKRVHGSNATHSSNKLALAYSAVSCLLKWRHARLDDETRKVLDEETARQARYLLHQASKRGKETLKKAVCFLKENDYPVHLSRVDRAKVELKAVLYQVRQLYKDRAA